MTQLVINRFSGQYLNVMVDAEHYRERRNETLIHLAQSACTKGSQNRKEVSLEPMPSYERKIIHTALMENKKIKTYSSGEDPHRHIVIAPK